MIYKCFHCNKEIIGHPCEKRKFCDRECRRQFSLITIPCIRCGKEFTCYRHLKKVYCSIKCSNKISHHNKGERIIQGGYICIYQPYHPFAKGNHYVREHRLVMEKHLKRFLKPEEVVHHINEIRTDNRIENLQLFPNNGKHMKDHPFNKGVKHWGANAHLK